MVRKIFYLLFVAAFLFASGNPVVCGEEIRISYGVITAALLPFYVAQDQGIYKKHGLDVEMIYMTGGAKVVQAVVSGSAQFGLANAGSGVDARLAGHLLRYIASIYDTYYFQIFGKANIRRPEDLKGKTIAASAAGAASDWGIRDALSLYGLVFGKDYKIAFMGGTSERVSALERGLVDAAIISPPNGLKAQKAGFKEILNLMELKLPFAYEAVFADETYIKNNRQTAKRFLRAYVEASAVSVKHKEIAMQVLSKVANINEREILEESYRTSVPFITKVPYVKKEIIERTLKLSRYAGAAKTNPDDFIDNSLVRELEHEGFLSKMYGK
ncbi:MAG: ABC transporter substrate-binding protein [Deltaproteobacteria bacterium]|nr:ABC transporter substrate-binding protein [Deltaproteobacteria bacterium]